jgi:hypothetical protein
MNERNDQWMCFFKKRRTIKQTTTLEHLPAALLETEQTSVAYLVDDQVQTVCAPESDY